MIRSIYRSLVVGAATALAVAAAVTPADAQRRSAAEWPRPEAPRVGDGASPPAPQEDLPGGDGQVFAMSALGAAGGWALGTLAGAALCREGCGTGEYDWLVPVVLSGVAGGWLGSVSLGCSAAREPGCVPNAMPRALLGTAAAVAASVLVISTTEDALASLVTFSLVQGVMTARAIR